MRPSLGVISYAPIQYHTPLWQLITKRGKVDIDLLFLSDRGISPINDTAFGVPITWDIDMLSGYSYAFLATAAEPHSTARQVRALARWIPDHDAVVVNGYTSAWMLMAMATCKTRRVPYLLRGSSHPEGTSSGIRRRLRPIATRIVVAGSADCLSMGHLNELFYQQNHARSVTFVPNSVDDERFACPPAVGRPELLAKWGLTEDLPLIVFSGRLVDRKRPLDLVEAVKRLPVDVNVLFVGDDPLAGVIRTSLPAGRAAVTGFINQAEIPAYYHAADIVALTSEIEAWGLVVNEAMAAGAMPVVSDRVGCAPDLVQDMGEVFRCGDVADLTSALCRAVEALRDTAVRDRMRKHVARYSLERTAQGFERAALAVTNRRQRLPINNR
jgi:glycosyltransferase involved in cell wall biosynthesis